MWVVEESVAGVHRERGCIFFQRLHDIQKILKKQLNLGNGHIKQLA